LVQAALHKVMRAFGRSCRGQGKILLQKVRDTERQLLEVGQMVGPLALKATLDLYADDSLEAAQQERLMASLRQAAQHYDVIEQQSRRLIHGKKLPHAKIVNAYDPAIAPIIKGKSNCPVQFGCKPGIIVEMATGFILGLHLPQGNPDDATYMIPLIDQVQTAIDAMEQKRKPRIRSVAGDLAFTDPSLREQLHQRGILTAGIPETVAPLDPLPTPEQIVAAQQTTHNAPVPSATQVKMAYACGYSRPFVEGVIQTLSCRGGTAIKYKRHRGALLQTTMAVLASNAATVVRIQQERLSKRARKFRRFFRLKPPNSLKNND
jgi:hypothetical protein